MTHTQVARLISISLLVFTSASLNAAFFYALGGIALVPVGLAIQCLGLACAMEFRRAESTVLTRWFATLIMVSCIVISVYAAQNTLASRTHNLNQIQVTQVSESIAAIDKQLLAFAENSVFTAAESLRIERMNLMNQLAELQAPSQIFSAVAGLLGLLLDVGAVFLVATSAKPTQASVFKPEYVNIQQYPEAPESEPVAEIQEPVAPESQDELPSMSDEDDMAIQVLNALAAGEKQRDVAERFGLSQSAVSRIKRNAA